MIRRGLLFFCMLAVPVAADEGLWLFNQFPKDAVAKAHSFDVTDAFLAHVQLASMRLGSGSGSFVTAHGLVLANHHVVIDCIARLSSAGHDYLRDGFYAATRQEELRCPGLEAAVLLKIEDVTGQIKEPAAEPAKTPVKTAAAEKAASQALEKRNAAIARLEKSCAESPGNVCSVVNLHSGERYDLYQYKRYSDLRLVFAPERAVSFFGGNPDSRTFQRYGLDFAFLRAYENGQPAETPEYFKWNSEPVKDGELIFAAGSPGATARLSTVAQLTFYRDTQMPLTVTRLASRIADLAAFGAKSPANLQAAQLTLVTLANEYKFAAGRLIGLQNDFLFARKANFERKLRSAVQHDPKLGVEGVKVWDDVATAYRTWGTSAERQYEVLESPGAVGSELFRMARQVVRLAEERAKPNDQRLAEFRDTALDSLEQSLYAPTPVEDGVEIALLTRYLDEIKPMNEKEVPVKAIFANKTSAQVAEEAVHSTKLKDVAERKRLAGDKAAAAASADGMIRLARLLDEPARRIRKRRQDALESLDASAAERIAQYRYRLFGAADYPDATGTPRLAFGVVKAYKDRTEAPVLDATTFGGLFHLAANNQERYALPQRWLDAKPQLDLETPMNFVSTCDITAGASGGPVLNAKGEIVGVTFDGNLESIALTYMYADDAARAVHVATTGIVAALQRIYKATGLLGELGIAAGN
ncbi:MAG TPA: S46 family peptidase [Bryobacteraceae bacterium]|nr:S46 family peptidase [Bryobacteraceae bacterium]